MDSTRLRSRTPLLILGVTLIVSFVLGALVLVSNRLDAMPPEAVSVPLTDEQSRQQVLEPARHFVGAGKLRSIDAGYLLTSCSLEEKPPYQGTVYLNFDVPSVAATRAYFREIARAMTARGWREGLPPGRHPGGHTMVKDGLYAVYHRDPNLPGRGVLKIYGECRNVTDHSSDNAGFQDITDEVQG
jgi:hypothetical protein